MNPLFAWFNRIYSDWRPAAREEPVPEFFPEEFNLSLIGAVETGNTAALSEIINNGGDRDYIWEVGGERISLLDKAVRLSAAYPWHQDYKDMADFLIAIGTQTAAELAVASPSPETRERPPRPTAAPPPPPPPEVPPSPEKLWEKVKAELSRLGRGDTKLQEIVDIGNRWGVMQVLASSEGGEARLIPQPEPQNRFLWLLHEARIDIDGQNAAMVVPSPGVLAMRGSGERQKLNAVTRGVFRIGTNEIPDVEISEPAYAIPKEPANTFAILRTGALRA